MQNNFNPYGNTYGNTYPNFYQQPKSQLIFVNGYEGAKAYQMMPNQMLMLLDSDNPIVYKKTTNNQGQASIEAFKLVPIEDVKETSEYVLRSDFEALVKRIDELTKQKESA